MTKPDTRDCDDDLVIFVCQQKRIEFLALSFLINYLNKIFVVDFIIFEVCDGI